MSFESFYGGRIGASFVIKKHFDGIDIPQPTDDNDKIYKIKNYAADPNTVMSDNPIYYVDENNALIEKNGSNYTKYSWTRTVLNTEKTINPVWDPALHKTGTPNPVTLTAALAEGMVQCFEQGGDSTDEVNYGEYVIIDTFDGLKQVSNPDNGKVFRRGINYTGDLGGAEYIGQITGPQGETPVVDMDTVNNIMEVSGAISDTYNMEDGMIPGKIGDTYNDEIKYAWVNLRDVNGNIDKILIGFEFPYLVVEFTGNTRSPYYQAGDTIPAGKSVGDLLLPDFELSEHEAESTEHPFYDKWKIYIPKGIKGDSLNSLEAYPIYSKSGVNIYDNNGNVIEVASTEIETDFSGDIIQINNGLYCPLSDGNNRYIKLDEGKQYHFRYKENNYDNTQSGTYTYIDAGLIIYVSDIRINTGADSEGLSGNQKIQVEYSDNGFYQEIGNPLNYIADTYVVPLKPQDVSLQDIAGHLLVYYSDPNKRTGSISTRLINQRRGWVDIGDIGYIADVPMIIGKYNSWSELENEDAPEEIMHDSTYKGWGAIYIDNSGTQCLAYYDYRTGQEKWVKGSPLGNNISLGELTDVGFENLQNDDVLRYNGTFWTNGEAKDEKVKQNPIDNNANYEILFSGTADNNIYTGYVGKDIGLKYNPDKVAFIAGTGIASGEFSVAEGSGTTASANGAHAEGHVTSSAGSCSHAEGYSTTAFGNYSHAEGGETIASGEHSHAEGRRTTASESASHSEGEMTCAYGTGSHAEGGSSEAIGFHSHAEGNTTCAVGSYSHAEGSASKAIGSQSHAEGAQTCASGESAHAEGGLSKAIGLRSHAEGNTTCAIGNNSHVEGNHTIAGSDNQHVQGKYNANKANTLFEIGNGTGTATTARSNAFEVYNNGKFSQDNGTTQFKFTKDNNGDKGYIDENNEFHKLVGVEQIPTNTDANYEILFSASPNNDSEVNGIVRKDTGLRYNPSKNGFMEGGQTIAYGNDSHAEGSVTCAVGNFSHAEGNQTRAIGDSSHAEGFITCAVGDYSHAEGVGTSAIGESSHAEGTQTCAVGNESHAEGIKTQAIGDSSHAEGFYTTACGDYSHTQGYQTSVINIIHIPEQNIMLADPTELRYIEHYYNGNTYSYSLPYPEELEKYKNSYISIEYPFPYEGINNFNLASDVNVSNLSATSTALNYLLDEFSLEDLISDGPKNFNIGHLSMTYNYSGAEGLQNCQGNIGVNISFDSSSYTIIAKLFMEAYGPPLSYPSYGDPAFIGSINPFIRISTPDFDIIDPNTAQETAYASAEGYMTTASQKYSHVMGYKGETNSEKITTKGLSYFVIGGNRSDLGTIKGRHMSGSLPAGEFPYTYTDDTSNNILNIDDKGNIFTPGTLSLAHGVINQSTDVITVELEDGAMYMLYANGIAVDSNGAPTTAVIQPAIIAISARYMPDETGMTSLELGLPSTVYVAGTTANPIRVTCEYEQYRKDNIRYYHSKIGISANATNRIVRWNLVKVCGSINDF